MERAVFERRVLQAAAEARDFAREFIAEPLPDAMIFRVHLNCSYDQNAGPEFKLFPDDSNDPSERDMTGITAEQVVDLLWRDGCVPQWVDISVVGETGEATVLELLACGRFIADEARLYYTWTDVAPFGVKGPVLPYRHVKGQRFSVYVRSACYSLDELLRAEQNAAKVRSLHLHGPAFTDEVLAAGLEFPALLSLELDGVPSEGAGLAGLAKLRRLEYLRVRLAGRERLDLGALPRLKALTTLWLWALPAELAEVGRLASALPRLKELHLRSDHAPRADAVLHVPTVEKLTLELADVPRWIAAPRALRTLRIHAPQATDDDVCRVLAACPDRLECVDLRGSPVTDRLLPALARFPALRSVDAVDTRIAEEALWRFAAGHPGFKCSPDPPEPVSPE